MRFDGNLINLKTMDVHARDVIDSMIKLNVETLENFNWNKQLRYYFEEDRHHFYINSVELVETRPRPALGESTEEPPPSFVV